MSYLKAFTTQLQKFVDELCEMFPNDKNIAMSKDTLYIIKKTNPRKLLDVFKTKFLPYEIKINEMDETFFLNRNYDNDVSKDIKILNAISNIKTYWKNLSDNSKKNIWLYLKVLIKLSKKA